MYPRSIDTVRLEIGAGLRFFGDRTVHTVVVWPVLPGGGRLVHTGSRYIIEDGWALKLEPSTSVDVPAVDPGGWLKGDSTAAVAWSYRVVVTASAPGCTPVTWSHVIAPTKSQHTVTLDPYMGGKISASASVIAASAIDAATGAAILPATAGITGATTLNEAASAA